MGRSAITFAACLSASTITKYYVALFLFICIIMNEPWAGPSGRGNTGSGAACQALTDGRVVPGLNLHQSLQRRHESIA